MKNRDKAVSIILRAVAVIIATFLSWPAMTVFGENSLNLPAEPTDIVITPSRFVPRIGSDVTYHIDHFGFENVDTGIGSDYRIEVYDFETEENRAQRFIRIVLPQIQLEQLVSGEWFDHSVNIKSMIMTAKSFSTVKEEAFDAGEETQDFIIWREHMETALEQHKITWDSISMYDIYFNLRTENGAINFGHANRLAHFGTVDFVFDIVDAPAKYDNITFQGISDWYTESPGARVSRPYPISWLYFETSDISIDLIDPKTAYEPGDTVSLKVHIKNTSEHLVNRRLVAGLDFGQKEIKINPVYTADEPDIYFTIPAHLGIGNMITTKIPAGETIEFTTEIVLPGSFDGYLRDSGDALILTPFLFTSNIYKDDNGQRDFRHYEEREYNAGIALPVREGTEQFIVAFDSNGGSPVEPQRLSSGGYAVLPPAPAMNGYVFLGWYLGDVAYDFSAPVTTDITLQARWAVDHLVSLGGEDTPLVASSQVKNPQTGRP